MDGDDGGVDVQEAGRGGGAQVSSGGVTSSLDRFLLLLAADETKKVRTCILYAPSLYGMLALQLCSFAARGFWPGTMVGSCWVKVF